MKQSDLIKLPLDLNSPIADNGMIAEALFAAGAIEIKDVDGGEAPFPYSTGNRGPGYVMIKGQVGNRRLMKWLTLNLAKKLAEDYGTNFEFVEGNATGGMVPAWELTNMLEKVLGLEEGSIPYTYLRESRKTAGHGELITGTRNNEYIQNGMKVLIFEELVNFAGTTTNAARIYREAGYTATHASTILAYDHQQMRDQIEESGLVLKPLITLPNLLESAMRGGMIRPAAYNGYCAFLDDALLWQVERGFIVPIKNVAKEGEGYTPDSKSLEHLTDAGYIMRQLTNYEVIGVNKELGEKAKKENITYWARTDLEVLK